MSVELVALVVSTLTMLLGFVTVIGWLVTRTDRQFDKLRDDLGSRIDGVEREIVEVKIASHASKDHRGSSWPLADPTAARSGRGQYVSGVGVSSRFARSATGCRMLPGAERCDDRAGAGMSR